MATLASPTLQNLLTGVRTLLNQRDPNNSFWRDDELTNYINEAIRIYFLEVVHTNEGYFTTTTTLNITTNTETVALPSDFFQLRALYKLVNNGYEILDYKNSVTEGYSTQGGTAGNSYRPSYYFRGNSLVLHPVPNFTESAGLLLEYIQFPDNLINGGDAMSAQISPIFKQLIEIYAVYKAKLKESMVNGVNNHKIPEENLASLYKTFKDSIQQRSRYPTFVEMFNPEGM